MLGYFLYRIGEALVLFLPLKFAYRIGIFLANLQFLFAREDRNSVISNLSIILPNENKANIYKKAKEVFVNFALYLVEFFRSSEVDLDFVKKNLSIKGENFLKEAIKNGKGGIILTAHMGNWELCGMALSLLGYPLIAIALDHKNTKVNDFFRKRRVTKGLEVVSLGVAVKKCYEGLKKNKFVGILGDRDFSAMGYPLDFLNRKKIIPRGPAVLALRTGAPIIPLFSTRKGIGHIAIECFSPIEVSNKTTEIEIMQRYTKIMEEQIYKNPSQWLMFREFWKE